MKKPYRSETQMIYEITQLLREGPMNLSTIGTKANISYISLLKKLNKIPDIETYEGKNENNKKCIYVRLKQIQSENVNNVL